MKFSYLINQRHKKQKTGQAAMEFLMTYGWAFMIVLIVIASLVYMGVLNPENFLPDKAEISNEVLILDSAVDEDSVVLILQNNAGKILYDLRLNITECNYSRGVVSEPFDIPAGKKKKIALYCVNTTDVGSKFKSDIKVDYSTRLPGTDEGALNHTSTGLLYVNVNSGRGAFAYMLAIIFSDPTPADGTVVWMDPVSIMLTATHNVKYVSALIDFDDSLVSWWRMDTVSGSTLVDYMNRNNATITGATQNDSGYFGKAMNFDGNDIVSAGNPASLKIIGDMTLSFWVYPTDVSAARENPIDKAYCGEFGITQETTGQLSYFHGPNGGEVIGYMSIAWQGIFIDDEWIHLVIVRDVSNQSVKLYRNGVEYDNGTISAEGWVRPSISTQPFTIGDGYAGSGFRGLIDDVLVFNRTITSQEVSALYADSISKTISVNLTLTDGLTEGNHVFNGYVQDRLGNVNYESARTITISPPGVIELLSPANNSELSGANGLLLNASVRSAGHDFFFYVSNDTTFDGNDVMGVAADVQGEVNISFNFTNAVTPMHTSTSPNMLLHFDNIPGMESYGPAGTVKNFGSTSLTSTIYEYNTPVYHQGGGRFGGAFEFEPSTVKQYEKITVTGMPSTGTTTPFTVSAWVKTTESAERGAIFCGDYGTSICFFLHTDGRVSLNMDDATGYGGTAGTNSVNDGEWHHVAASYSGSTHLVNLYVDGEWITQNTTVYDGNGVGTVSTWYVGYQGRNLSTYHPNNHYFVFDGLIDDLAFWHSKVLSPTEIANLYNSSYEKFYWKVNVTNRSNALGNQSEMWNFTWDSTNPGIVQNAPNQSHWQSSATMNFNYTASDNNGIDMCILYGNFSGTWGANETNTSFTSGIDDVATISITLNQEYLWNVWCNDTFGNEAWGTNRTFYAGNIPPIITLNTPGNESGTNSDALKFNFTVESPTETNFTCNLTVDGTVRENDTAFVNGVANVMNYTSPGDTLHTWSAKCWFDGDVSWSSTSQNYLHFYDTVNPSISLVSPTPVGSEVDVNSIYVNVTANDGNDHYQVVDFGGDLIVFMNMESLNGSGDGVIDNSTHGLNASINGSWQVAGRWGKGMQFDGINDSLRIEDNDYMNNYTSPQINITDRTISLWFRANNVVEKQIIFEEGGGSNGLSMYIYDSKFIIGGWAVNGDWDTPTYLNSSTISAGEWYHVIWMLKNASSGMQNDSFKGYINGVMFAEGNGSNMWSHGGDIWFGGTDSTYDPENGTISAASYHFNGTIDEFVFYNRALDDSEILALYNGTANRAEHNYTNLTEGITYDIIAYAADIGGNVNSAQKSIYVKKPVIGLDIIYPASPLNKVRNTFFNVTVNVTCYNKDCGQINVSLNLYNLYNTTFEAYKSKGLYTGSSATDLYSGMYSNNYMVAIADWAVSPIIGVNADVISATAYFKCKYTKSAPFLTLGAFRITESWTEASATSVSTGPDWASSYEGTHSGAVTSGVTYGFNVTNFARGWANETYSMNGLAITTTASPVGSSLFTYFSADGGTGGPDLEIVYTKPNPISTSSSNLSFYTNETNPRTITLAEGESQVLTFWVNATADFDDHQLYARAINESRSDMTNQSDYVNVTILSPVLGLDLLYPTTNINVSLNSFFNVTVNVSCMGQDCGEVNVSLDPQPLTVTWDDSLGPDCITDSVCLARGSTGPFYNTVYDANSPACPCCGPYIEPTGTQWAYGNCDNPGSKTFEVMGLLWGYTGCDGGPSSSGGWSPNAIIGDEICIYIELEDTYVDFKLTAWGCCGQGTYTYMRSVAGTKSGLINDTIGATPYYTNESNPRTIALDNGESQTVVFWVNATGELMTSEFFAYANVTTSSTINNITNVWDVTIQ